MACWLTTLCLLSSFACIWSGVIHTDSDLEVGHGITLDNVVDSTNDGLVNFPQENVTLRISAETNVSSTSLESEIHRNVSENVTVNENIHVISNETEDPSSSSGYSDTVNKLIVSVKNFETLIDVNSTGSVSIASESTRDNTTQTSTEIKSTEKFSSQIPSDSPTPTLSSVTNSSLVVKESVTEAERVNSTTASSNIDVNDTILQTAQPSNTDVQTTVSSNNLLITKTEENGVVLDVILDNFTTTTSAATDISSSSFIQPSADSGHVQDLRMLSNSTDGFDLIMDSTIDSSVDIGTVKMEVNSTDPTKITNDIVTVTNVLDTVSIDVASLNSGTSGTPQTSTDNGITPVSSSTGQFKGNSPGITETVTFETARRTTSSTAIPSISVETENNSVGSSVSTAMESVSETTTSMDKVINPQIQITEQVTLPAVTASTTTSNSLQATNKPTVLITDSTPETTNKPTVSVTDSTPVITNKPTISVTDSTPEISTESVLPPIHIKSVSTETDDQTSTQNQIESTKNSDKTTMVNAETTSEVEGTNSNLRATTVISQHLKTTNKMQEPLESTTVPSGSSLLSTIETGVSSIDIENSTISGSEAASLIVESTAKAGVTGETTEENTIQMTVQLPGINTETTKPVTGTIRMTTAQSTTDNKVELSRAMTTSRVTTKVETTVPMATDPVKTTTTTTTSTTTHAPSTTIVNTTPRPCPEYQSKYNRNDLIVSTDPEGCVMIAKIVDLRGRFRGPNRMIWRKMHAGLRGLRYPSVSFTYKGSEDAEDKCQMPVKSVGPYIVVDTIPGRCQMVVGLRSVRAPVNTPGKKGQQQRRFRFRLVMRPVLEYLEGTLL